MLSEVHVSAPNILNATLEECVVVITRLMGRPRSIEALNAGLPHSPGDMPPGHVDRAIRPVGLVADIQKLSAKKLSKKLIGLPMPMLLELNSGSWVVLTKILDTERFELRNPENPEEKQIISPQDIKTDFTGLSILVKRDNERPASSPSDTTNSSQPHWFWSIVRAFWRDYSHVALAALLINILSLVTPIYIMNVYDRVLPNSAQYTLWALSIGAILAIVFDLVFKMLRAGIVNDVGRRADIIIGSRIFEHVLDLKLKNRPELSGVFSNQIREFDSVKEFFTSSSLIAATDFLFLFVGVFVMFLLVGPLAWAVALAVPIVLLISISVQKPLYNATAKSMEASAIKQARTVELASMLDTYRVLGAGPTALAEWEPVLSTTSKTAEKAKFWSNLAQYGTAFVLQMVTVVIIILGVFLVQNNSISPGAMIAAVIISGRILAPLGNIASTLIRFNQSLNSFRTLNTLMTLPVEHPYGKQYTARQIDKGTISFQDVTFSYVQDQMPAIKSISLKIAPGERVGIIGRIGSGKSTIGRLLANLYTPDEGCIRIDGIDIQQYDPADLRKGIGFLMQDMPLRLGSIRDNIIMGKPDATDEEVIEAARFSGVDKFVASHPLGFGIQTGEGGRNLSGGQRQSVSLARVLIRKPQILILDEPTTSLDPQTENMLLRQLNDYLGKDRSLLMITQRPAALKLVTRIIVVEQGKILLDGPRDEIIAELNSPKKKKPKPPNSTSAKKNLVGVGAKQDNSKEQGPKLTSGMGPSSGSDCQKTEQKRAKGTISGGSSFTVQKEKSRSVSQATDEVKSDS